MLVKLPNLQFKTKVYGISIEVFNNYIHHYDKDPETTLSIKSTFYIKRSGILKRWDTILANLPDLVDISVKSTKHRTIKRTEKAIPYEGDNGVYYSSTAEYKMDKRKGNYGKNLINEYVTVVIERPLLFTNNLHAEAERAVKIREFIYAENTRLKSMDRINHIMGKEVMPEYDEETLNRLHYLRKGELLNNTYVASQW